MFSFLKKKITLVSGRHAQSVEMNPILEVLDKCADAFTFPMLDNGYVYLAASRLTAYHGSKNWALVFEVFGFSPRAGSPDLAVITIGNDLRNRKSKDDYASEDAYENYLKNNPSNEYKSFFPIGGDNSWVNPDDNEIVMPNGAFELRGKSYNLPSLSDYSKHDIELKEKSPWVHELCRYLASDKRDAVLATDDERRYNVPIYMSEILCLDDWYHPDLANEEKPSQLESIRQLSKVLISGDASHYNTKLQGNTHWKNWPDGGTL